MRGATAFLGVALGLAALVAALRRLDAVEVRGRSMAPTLFAGDRLLVVRRRRAPSGGDVVLAADPRRSRHELIKRVHTVGSAGVILRGDNPASSTDSRSFGAVPPSAVRWQAVLRYWPPRRFGRIQAAPAGLALLREGGEPACAFPDALIAGEAR